MYCVFVATAFLHLADSSMLLNSLAMQIAL
jgi:hypothetical protein